MGMADVATVLFENHLKFDATAPYWQDRDRFILSAGHGSMLIYSLLHLTGYADMTIDQIRNFRQWGAITAGHPEYGHTVGVETTTGPLGQGCGNAVGMAIAEEMLAARFNTEAKKVVETENEKLKQLIYDLDLLITSFYLFQIIRRKWQYHHLHQHLLSSALVIHLFLLAE